MSSYAYLRLGDLYKEIQCGLTIHTLPWRHIKSITLLPTSQFSITWLAISQIPILLSKYKQHFIKGNQSYQYTFYTTFEHFSYISAYYLSLFRYLLSLSYSITLYQTGQVSYLWTKKDLTPIYQNTHMRTHVGSLWWSIHLIKYIHRVTFIPTSYIWTLSHLKAPTSHIYSPFFRWLTST